MTVTPELILFSLLAPVAVGSALGMLFSRNAVHSALFLVLNFATVAFFFLFLGAAFIAMVQVTVYAGAIMVLFLFVIMLLGAELLRQPSAVLPWQPPLTVFLGVLFLGVVLIYFLSAGSVGLANVGADAFPPTFTNDAAARAFGSPQAIGTTLFQDYVLPFEITSFLLLVGMIGAVVLTRDENK
jgi:NADH-quinone oxidoreductase subunit J